jgi:hypothetical protein
LLIYLLLVRWALLPNGFAEKKKRKRNKEQLEFKTVLSWMWWCTLVLPAIWEAEAGESLESRS